MQRTKVEDLDRGPWNGEIPQGPVGVCWALRTRGTVECPTASISTVNAAARPDNTAEPKRRRERAEGGDTEIRAGKEGLSVNMQMEESVNTDVIGMKVKAGKKEGRGCDTAPGSKFGWVH